MKGIKKVAVVLVTLALVAICCTTTTFAAAKTEYGLNVEVSTEQERYTKNDDVKRSIDR